MHPADVQHDEYCIFPLDLISIHCHRQHQRWNFSIDLTVHRPSSRCRKKNRTRSGTEVSSVSCLHHFTWEMRIWYVNVPDFVTTKIEKIWNFPIEFFLMNCGLCGRHQIDCIRERERSAQHFLRWVRISIKKWEELHSAIVSVRGTDLVSHISLARAHYKTVRLRFIFIYDFFFSVARRSSWEWYCILMILRKMQFHWESFDSSSYSSCVEFLRSDGR